MADAGKDGGKAENTTELPLWKSTPIRWLKRVAVVGALVCVWLVLGRLGVVGASLYQSGSMIFALVLFVLALPISMLLRLDELFYQFGVDDFAKALVVALAYAALNAVMLGALIGRWRDFMKRLRSEKSEAPADRSKMNGAGRAS